jgi:hypothetical protein
MDLKRRLSVKAQLPLKKKQNSKTFPLTWNQKNNNRVGINNKFALNSFKVPAGVGNRYFTGCESKVWWWVFLKTKSVFILKFLCYNVRPILVFSYFCLWTYGFGVFFLDFLGNVWWPEVDPQTAFEVFKLQPEIRSCNKTLDQLTNSQATLLSETPASNKSPKVRNRYSDVILTGVYFSGFVLRLGTCLIMTAVVITLIVNKP